NWNKPFYVSLSTGESVAPGTPGSIPVPTYRNYVGGFGYSAGEFGGVLLKPAVGIPYSYAQLLAIGNAQQDPVDILDYYAYVHDVRSQTVPVYNATQAQFDAALLGSVVA